MEIKIGGIFSRLVPQLNKETPPPSDKSDNLHGLAEVLERYIIFPPYDLRRVISEVATGNAIEVPTNRGRIRVEPDTRTIIPLNPH